MSVVTRPQLEGVALAIAVFKQTMEARNADCAAWFFEDQNMTVLIAKGQKAGRLRTYANRSFMFRRGCDRVKSLRVVYEK